VGRHGAGELAELARVRGVVADPVITRGPGRSGAGDRHLELDAPLGGGPLEDVEAVEVVLRAAGGNGPLVGARDEQARPERVHADALRAQFDGVVERGVELQAGLPHEDVVVLQRHLHALGGMRLGREQGEGQGEQRQGGGEDSGHLEGLSAIGARDSTPPAD
jgi:hypothetical protein